MADDGNDTELPAFLVESHESLYLAQFPFVEGFYNDITDAAIDKTPIDPLLARCLYGLTDGAKHIIPPSI